MSNLNRLQWDMASAGSFVIDASALRHFDSSALAVLIACRRHAAALGTHVYVSGLSPELLALTHVYGIEELLCS